MARNQMRVRQKAEAILQELDDLAWASDAYDKREGWITIECLASELLEAIKPPTKGGKKRG